MTKQLGKELSPREILILRALIEGASDTAIAKLLVLRESAVKKSVQALLRKLGVQNRTEAANWARDKLGDV